MSFIPASQAGLRRPGTHTVRGRVRRDATDRPCDDLQAARERVGSDRVEGGPAEEKLLRLRLRALLRVPGERGGGPQGRLHPLQGRRDHVH